MTPTIFSVQTGTELRCKGWRQEALLRLLENVLAVGEAPQDLVVDYAVHHVRANGGTSPKVFKGWKLTLRPGETRALAKRHSLRPVTTRTLYPGLHRVEVLVNGSAVAAATFDLQA